MARQRKPAQKGGTALLTRAEVADRLGVAYPTVAQWQKKKWLPSVKRGREVMIPESALAAFEAERKAKHRARVVIHSGNDLILVSERDLTERITRSVTEALKGAGRRVRSA